MKEDEESEGRVSLRLLSIFSALMGGATTVEAAEQLGLSQPAVSNGIRQLESILGINLFERLHRRLTPTEEAFQLFSEIQPVFPILRGFEARAKAMRQGLSGRLRVLSTPPLGHTVGAAALGRLIATRPAVTVSYDVRRLESVIEAVQNGLADIGLGLGFDTHPALGVEVAACVDMVCVLPREHPLADREAIAAADLAAHDFIGLEAESRLGSVVRLVFQRERVRYAPRVEVRYCSTAAVLALRVGAVAVVDPFTAMQCDAALTIRRFEPCCRVPVSFLSRRGVPRSGLVNAYIAELRADLKLCDARTNGSS